MLSELLYSRGVVLAENYYVSQLLDRYGSILSEKQQRILDGYYNNDLSLSEIAENEGITRQGVRDFVKRSELQLFEFEEKLGICKKSKELKEILDKVKLGQLDLNSIIEFSDNF